MPVSNAVEKHETMTAKGETSMRRVGKIPAEEREISRDYIVITGNGVDWKPASSDSFFDKLVFILLAVVGIIARQQREMDPRLHMAVRFLDQSEEVAIVFFVRPGDVKIAEVNPGKLLSHG